jgi:hypothetical protein
MNSAKISPSVPLLSALAGLALLAIAGYAHEPKASKTLELVGTVIDVACFVGHDSIGEKHAACAEACAKAGNPLAILDAESGRIYLPISMDHKDPNAKLIPFVEKRVKVSGSVVEKAGLRGIAIQTVVPAN